MDHGTVSYPSRSVSFVGPVRVFLPQQIPQARGGNPTSEQLHGEGHDGHLTGSRPAAVEPVDMMPSRLSSKQRPDLTNKDAEHASLKLDSAAGIDEKWTLASGDIKHDAGDARAREKRPSLCVL